MIKMKVGIVSGTGYRDYPIGGTLSFLKNILKFIDDGGDEFILLGSARGNEKIGKKHSITIGDKTFTFFPFYKRIQCVPGRLNSYFSLYRFLRKIKKLDLDVFYVHSPELVPPLLYLNTPIIFHMHGATHPLAYSKFKGARSKLAKSLFSYFILKPAITESSLVIGINDDCERLAHEMGQKNFVKIPVCVDTNIFRPMDKIKCKKQIGFGNDFLITYTGRFGKAKGLELLLKSFKILNNKYNSAKLILIGEGEEKEYLKKLAKSLVIEKSVNFIGSLPNEELPVWLNASDIYSMTSYAEGVPLSLLEAMACGLPVISTDVGGINSLIINGRNGILIKKREPELVVNLIFKAIKNKDYIVKNARETIIENFSAKVVSNRIQSLIKSVIHNKIHATESRKNCREDNCIALIENPELTKKNE